LAAVVFAMLLSACSPQPSTASLGEKEPQAEVKDVSGKWSGSFDVTLPDGNVQNNTAVLILKQDGNSVQ
jgi:hypothetical protein